MKKLLLAMAAVAMIFVGCSKDDDKTIDNLGEKILGRWINAEMDWMLVQTNQKMVMNFLSDTKAVVSASFNDEPEGWLDFVESDVVIEGNKITMTNTNDEYAQVVSEYTISSINDREFTAIHKLTVIINGVLREAFELPVRYVKVNVDYSAAILGMWEGRSTGEDSEFDDGKNHRWEYLADSTFHYFHKENDRWQISDDAYAYYFVAGNLLCTRWKNEGAGQEEHREWWEISSIENDTMNWTALRQREDGTTYTATFQMVKVSEN